MKLGLFLAWRTVSACRDFMRMPHGANEFKWHLPLMLVEPDIWQGKEPKVNRVRNSCKTRNQPGAR